MSRTTGPRDFIDRQIDLIAVDKWLDDGPGLAYELVIESDDEFGHAVVAELVDMGYNAEGERRQHSCNCKEHLGAEVPDPYFTVKFSRPTERIRRR